MRALVPLLVAASACAEDPAVAAPAPAADSGSACTRGFATAPIDWPLPVPARGTLDATCSGDGDELMRLIDLDGDRAPELVRVYDCDRGGPLGDTEWWVHRNDGDGFTAAPEVWALPQTGTDYAFGALRDGACESAPDTLFELTDLDGDLRPDLVVLSDCLLDGPLGSSEWAVYLNTGAGFAAEPIAWSAPAELAPDGWRTTDQEQCGRFNTDLFTLRDLDGDLAPELVRTAGCVGEGQVEALGRWDVWRNTGAGFAAQPEAWALPTDHGGDGWPSLTGNLCERDPDHLHGTLDFTGDRIADLVVSSSCDRDGVWDERWLLYVGTGAGFEPAIDWRPPPTHVPGAWQRPFPTECTVPNDRKTLLTDLTGDQLPDLVLLGACLGETTPAAWEVHVHQGDGFSAEPEMWWLPEDDEPMTWSTLHDARCGDADDSLMEVFDIDGDRLPDLVETYGCDPDDPIGRDQWRVRLGGCIDR